MDSVLQELREHRDKLEIEFNQLLDSFGELRPIIHKLQQNPDLAEGEKDTTILSAMLQTIEISQKLINDLHLLENAKKAELARQLTVLPLERVDQMIDTLERRVEGIDARLIRLEKKLSS